MPQKQNTPISLLNVWDPKLQILSRNYYPPGTPIELEFDQQRTDKYGRTLARVFLSGDRLVNAEIAREGLGFPIFIEPNKKFLPPVEEAFEEAKKNNSGVMSANISCTVPAQVETIQNGWSETPSASSLTAAENLIMALEDPEIFDYPFISKIAKLPNIKSDIREIKQNLSKVHQDTPEESTAKEKPAPTFEQEQAPQLEQPAPRPAPDAPETPNPPAPQVPQAPPAPEAPGNPQPNIVEPAPPGDTHDMSGYTGPVATHPEERPLGPANVRENLSGLNRCCPDSICACRGNTPYDEPKPL